jgi:hypothetical protein
MQFSKLMALGPLAAFSFMPTEALAMYACAVAEVFECTAVAGCKRVSAKQANLPPMVTLNVKEKKLFSGLFGGDALFAAGEIHEDEKILVLHGRHGLQTWTAVVDKSSGGMSGTISQLGRTFSQFGHCTRQQQ